MLRGLFSLRLPGFDLKMKPFTELRRSQDNKLISLQVKRRRIAEESSVLDSVWNDSVGVRGFDRGPDIAVAVFLAAVSVGAQTYCHVDDEENESDL